LDSAAAEKYLRVVRSLGCRSVHIGGGEPMLRPEKLGEVLNVAANVGVSIEYVETNSAWFQDLDSAVSILRDLRRQGIRTLLVSISPFHNEFIPFSRVQGVIEACRKTDISVFPWINGFVKDLSKFDTDQTHSLEAFEDKLGQDYLLSVLKRYWIHMGGRSLETFRSVLTLQPHQRIIAENPVGCAFELTDTSHFHIDLFGNYIPGLCSGLSIACEDLGKPLSESRYPVLTTLYRSGIKGIFTLAQKELSYVPKRSGYINKCDLCTEIRTLFVKNEYGGLAEFNPKEFYAELE
jgi:hypothetical protein